MANIELKILMPPENNTPLLLDQMGPARNNMAVVEPVMIPIPPEPPDMIRQPHHTNSSNRPENMDIDTDIISHSMSELNEPMTDVEISIEEKELDYPEELNSEWVDHKIVFNRMN